MNRRRLVEIAAVTGIAASSGGSRFAVAAQPATAGVSSSPADTTTGPLAARLNTVSPEALLDALLSTPVTTPLFPADTTGVVVEPWVDTSDDDLEGTIGAVSLMGNGSSSTTLVGNATVFPDTGAAAARFAALAPAPARYRDLPWIQQGFADYAISAVVAGPMVLAGGAELPDDVRLNDSASDPEPRQLAQLESRAIINMVAMLDHLEDVLAAIGS